MKTKDMTIVVKNSSGEFGIFLRKWKHKLWEIVISPSPFELGKASYREFVPTRSEAQRRIRVVKNYINSIG